MEEPDRPAITARPPPEPIQTTKITSLENAHRRIGAEGSGKTDGKHRLNTGGNRDANNALWRIVLTRMQHDPRTKAYVARRTAQGKDKKYVMRALKRYVAREVYAALMADQPSLATTFQPTSAPTPDAA